MLPVATGNVVNQTTKRDLALHERCVLIRTEFDLCLPLSEAPRSAYGFDESLADREEDTPEYR